MKMCKKILAMMIAVVMVCSLAVPTFAAEVSAEESMNFAATSEIVITRDDSGNVQFEVPNNAIEPRIPGWANLVQVGVKTLDQNRVRVSIQNIGLDWVDSVSMNIKIYNPQGLQYNVGLTETNIVQLLPRNNDYYVSGWNRIVITNIVVKDEGDSGKLADIDYSK